MGMSDPIIIIECDQCGTKDEYELTCMAGHNLWSDRSAKEYFECGGWVFKEDGDTLCEDCAKGEE